MRERSDRRRTLTARPEREHDGISRRLAGAYAALRGHFGYTPGWWPGTPLEVTLAALLVQQCDWAVAWAAVAELRRRGLLSLDALARAPAAAVLDAIRGVAFAPTKAGRLVHLAGALVARGHADVTAWLDPRADPGSLRHELLALPGVGPETADAILLFASSHPSFVIDAYTRRIFDRVRLFPEVGAGFWASGYAHVQAFFETHLSVAPGLYDGYDFEPAPPRVALYRDWHAQLVELGKHHCRKRAPICRGTGVSGWKGYEPCRSHCQPPGCRACPLLPVCRTGQQASG